jgi:kinesin family member 22
MEVQRRLAEREKELEAERQQRELQHQQELEQERESSAPRQSRSRSRSPQKDQETLGLPSGVLTPLLRKHRDLDEELKTRLSDLEMK